MVLYIINHVNNFDTKISSFGTFQMDQHGFHLGTVVQ